MFLLDTNVVSAVMSPKPARAVVDWLNRQETTSLHLPTVAIAEIGYGLWVMPAGKRRRDLEAKFEQFVAKAFDQRVLAFDAAAARLYGELMGRRRALGRPMSIADGQIAAIARVGRLTVVTRNTRDFEDCGIDLVDPFA